MNLWKSLPLKEIPLLAWQPTPVCLPGESHGQRSLADCSSWGHKEPDTWLRDWACMWALLTGKVRGEPCSLLCLKPCCMISIYCESYSFCFFFFLNSPYSFIKEILFSAWLFLWEYKIFKSIILVWVALGAEQEIDLNANTGLAKKCIWIFHKMVWKNLNELFGQQNSSHSPSPQVEIQGTLTGSGKVTARERRSIKCTLLSCSGSLWRRKSQLTPVFLPGESHGQRSLAGYSRWGPKSQIQLSD